MVDIIALIVWAAELAIAAVILYYVVLLLPMPDIMKRVVQALIILVCILVVLGRLIGAPLASSMSPARPLSPSNPSIIR